MFGIDDLLIGGVVLGAGALAQEEQKKKQARQQAQSAFSMTPRIAQPSPAQPQASTLPMNPMPQPMPSPQTGQSPYDTFRPAGPVLTGSGGTYQQPMEGSPGVQPTPREGYQPQAYRETLGQEGTPPDQNYNPGFGRELTPEMAAQKKAQQDSGTSPYLSGLLAAGALGGAAWAAQAGRKGFTTYGPSPGGLRELPGGGTPQQFGAQNRALQNYLDYYRQPNRGGGGMGYGF